MDSVRLLERVDFTGAEFVESPDGQRIVKNVVMLGPVSSHGYEYTQEAMRRAVEGGLYEGCRCFIDHAAGSRSVMDLAGQFKNVRFESGKIKGDAHLLDDDKGGKFWTIAKTAPAAAGCSHVAEGNLVSRDGKRFVDEIRKVYSVDLVVQGATTKNVFESKTISESVPRPGPKERQFEYIARGVALVKATNPTIGDDEATAACFAAWSSRFEPGGTTDENPLPIAPTPAAKQESTAVTTGPTAQKESNPMTTQNTNALDQIQEHLDAVEKIAKFGLPVAAEVTRKASMEEADRAYEQRCADRRENARKLEEISAEIGDPGTFRETDDAFARRCRERRTLREQTASQASRIAEQAAAGANLTE
ncbi:MAG: hypothetical protein ABFE01_07410 [Phycisphaerales bacterium]